jgi:WD40 repeat protein
MGLGIRIWDFGFRNWKFEIRKSARMKHSSLLTLLILGVVLTACRAVASPGSSTVYPTAAISIIPALETQVPVLQDTQTALAEAAPTAQLTPAIEASEPPPAQTLEESSPVQVVPSGGLGGIAALSYAPDGGVLYLATTLGLVQDREGVQQALYAWPEAVPASLATFSADGTALAARLNHGEIVFLRLPGAEALQTFQTSEWPTALALAPDGSRLAAAVGEDSVRVWDTSTGELMFEFTPTSGWGVVYQSLAFSPAAKTLAGGFMNFVELWSPSNGGKSRIDPSCRSEQVFDLAFSPDGKDLAILCGPDDGEPLVGFLIVWDIAGDQAVFRREEILQMQRAAYSPDGRWLATGGPDGTMMMWDAAGTGEPYAVREQAAPITGLAFSRDGKILVSASKDGLAFLKMEEWLQIP